jgi:hypothetical protein
MRTISAILCALASASMACSSSSASPPDAGEVGLNPVDASADAPHDAADDGSDQCGHPAMTTYGCTAEPPTEGQCQGGPLDAPDASVTASYPLGCVATVPRCSSFYPMMAVTCTCNPLGMTSMWDCTY